MYVLRRSAQSCRMSLPAYLMRTLALPSQCPRSSSTCLNAHPGIALKGGNAEQIACFSMRFADCLHWTSPVPVPLAELRI